ncbi:hypothetical protein L3X38_043635 [Prunus dulcis]|uniref:Uncharacterized protein n=1 Tax=Prunus dulcis TaxID=3755 RepID=A0AAD4UX78_PRUDU|nr:hypothetical protein L3X38_043635 [Prunus dulcis]
MIKSIPVNIKQASSLLFLCLINCKSLQSLPELPLMLSVSQNYYSGRPSIIIETNNGESNDYNFNSDHMFLWHSSFELVEGANFSPGFHNVTEAFFDFNQKWMVLRDHPLRISKFRDVLVMVLLVLIEDAFPITIPFKGTSQVVKFRPDRC